MDPHILEEIVDRALRELPAPRAPHTLLPRVMRAVRAGVVTAPLVGWRTWPLSWQIAAVAGLLLVGFGAINLARVSADLVGFYVASSAADGTSGRLLQELSTVASALRVLWRVVIEPLVVFGGIVLVIMCAACAAFGTAIGRVALGGASRL
jgi:hypothetical protein